jgi:hypothetical protein
MAGRVTTTLTRERARDMLMVDELCRRSFPDFLDYVKVRGDDPLNPAITAWEPWPHLVERNEAWARGESEVILKDRQLGFTWDFAAFVDWCARNGKACGLISKGQDEARALLGRVKFVEMHLPEWMQVGAVFRADSAEYPSGGSVQVFPSTEDAGVSYTFQLVGMDEAAFHPYGGANHSAIRPTISAGGQILIFSTADPQLGPSGFFHDIYWASKRGETPYHAVFVPWHRRPGRDATWLARERSAYAGRLEEFDAYYADTDAQAFTGRSGLVYPQFNEVRHVKVARIPITACTRIVAGVDWGGGDPTAVVVLGMDNRQDVHQYAEFYRRGPVSVEDIVAFLSRYPVRQVRCGADEPVAIATLAKALPSMDVGVADTRRGEGLGLVAFLLDHDRLTIEPDNKASIAEFPGYRWAERTDPNDKTRYATKTPVDHHADAMDGRRYACAELLAFMLDQPHLPVHTMSGRPLSRKAS